MKLVGLFPVRNEAWCLGLSLRVALSWCDFMVVLNHESTDDSLAIIQDLERETGRISTLSERGEWNEMEHRQKMLLEARRIGSTHISMIDVDEVLCSGISNLRAWIEGVPRGTLLELPGYNLRGGIDRYHSDGIWGTRWFSLAFRDEPAAHWGGDKFHSREPSGIRWTRWRPQKQGEPGVMHLWGASERRLRAKHALYKATERLRWPDKAVVDIDHMYSWAIKGDPTQPAYGVPEMWKYNAVPKEWWAGYADWMKYLDLDAEPWQEAEVRRLVEAHGREKFAGLDLFGVV